MIWIIIENVLNNIIIGWGSCHIRNNQGWGKRYKPSQRPRLITLTQIIHCFEENNDKHTVARSLNWKCYWKSCIACNLQISQIIRITDYRFVSYLLSEAQCTVLIFITQYIFWMPFESLTFWLEKILIEDITRPHRDTKFLIGKFCISKRP